MAERGVIGMEGEWDKGLEAVSIVLHFTQLQKMVHAVFVVFDVTVEHGGVRLETGLVRHARGFEPLASIDLVVANDVTDAIGEDLGSAAGAGVDSGFLHALESLRDSELGA